MPDRNRRTFLQAIGTGVLAAGYTGIAAADGDGPLIEVVTGAKANELRSLALRSEEFRTLATHARAEYGANVDTADASVYRSNEHDGRYAVEFPLPVGDDVEQSAIGVIVEDGTVSYAVGSKVDVDDGRVTRYTQFDVGPTGAVETESVSLETGAERQAVITGDTGDGPSTAVSDCSLCIGALERICPYGCGLSGAVVCSLIGIVSFPAGLGCAAFFAIYCVEITLSGACWYTDGPYGDCQLMDFC